jgi:hypothetical protein
MRSTIFAKRLSTAIFSFLIIAAFGIIFAPNIYAQFVRTAAGTNFTYGFGYDGSGYGYGYGYGAGGPSAYGHTGNGKATTVSATAARTSITVTYTTTYTASNIVKYGGDSSTSAATTAVSQVAGSHSVTISSLTCGRTYYYKVETTDAGSDVWDTDVYSISTTACNTGGGGTGSSTYIPTETPTIVKTDVNKPARLANLVSINVSVNSLLKLQDDGNAATQEDSAVYFVGEDGYRHAFPNSKVYFTWYPNFSGIKIVSANDLASIPLGSNVRYRPGVKMVKFTTDNKVYAVATNGTLRWVTTEAIAAALYGSNWNTKIDDISDAFYTNYTFGADITSADSYNPAQQTASVPTISVDIGA